MLHGIPKKFHHRALHRIDGTIKEEHNPHKQLRCTLHGGSGFHYYKNIHFCLNEGIGDFVLNRTVSKLQLLNNIATIFFHVSSPSPTHGATPYLTLQLVPNNHGSWVDILTEVTYSKVAPDIQSVPTSFKNFETFHSHWFCIKDKQKLRKTSGLTESLLWIENESSMNGSYQFTLDLEVNYENMDQQQISSLKWKQVVQMSKYNPVHCVSISGVISSGSLSQECQGETEEKAKTFVLEFEIHDI